MERQFNIRSPAVKRLMREAQELKESTEQYHAQPLEDNLFEWHFTIRGPEDTAFEGGIYHGRIVLPTEYPMKPPSIYLLTPNGRFEIYKKICLSISGHHPESWQPSWSIRTALLAMIGFMPTAGQGAIGSLDYSDKERKVLAKKSAASVCEHCGPLKTILKEVTEESKKTAEEAKDLAAQIDFKGEKEGGKKNENEKTPEERDQDSSTPAARSTTNVPTTTTNPAAAATTNVPTTQAYQMPFTNPFNQMPFGYPQMPNYQPFTTPPPPTTTTAGTAAAAGVNQDTNGQLPPGMLPGGIPIPAGGMYMGGLPFSAGAPMPFMMPPSHLMMMMMRPQMGQPAANNGQLPMMPPPFMFPPMPPMMAQQPSCPPFIPPMMSSPPHSSQTAAASPGTSTVTSTATSAPGTSASSGLGTSATDHDRSQEPSTTPPPPNDKTTTSTVTPTTTSTNDDPTTTTGLRLRAKPKSTAASEESKTNTTDTDNTTTTATVTPAPSSSGRLTATPNRRVTTRSRRENPAILLALVLISLAITLLIIRRIMITVQSLDF